MARSYSLEGVSPKPGDPGAGKTIDYRAELNEQQYQAVTSLMGPALVIAGAGSGKTRTLTYRVAYLLDNGIAPENILLLTFTNKAAREMNERVEAIAPASTAGIWAGTFHSIGARILRRHAERIGFTRNFGILDSDDQRAMITKLVKSSGVAENAQERLGEKFPKPAVIASILGLAANTDVEVETILERQYSFFEDTDRAILKVAKLYGEKKKEGNHMDFDDLLVRTRQLLVDDKEIRALYQSQFQFILVDEYQDTNAVQGEVIDLLAEKHGNLMVVGDDAQSIYSWRGADYSNILDFPRRYKGAQVYKIETNYRSVPEVLALANASIRANQSQFPKELVAARPAKSMRPAFVPTFNPNMQAKFVSQRIRELNEDEGIEYDDMAVLYRSHFHSMELQMQLTTDGVPFVITSGLRFFEQAHIKDVAAYLKFAMNPKDDVSFERMVKLMAGIGPASADKLWQAWLNSDVVAKFNEDGNLPEYYKDTLLKFKVPAKAQNDWSQMAHVMDEIVNAGELLEPEKMIACIRMGIYDDYMKAAFDNADTRKQDLDQFQAFASGFQKVEEFLEQMALLGGADGDPNQDKKQEDEPSVVLSSVHQAKGLEWKVVFVIWLADGMFPNKRAVEEGGMESLEEERRLFYVAVTRAEDELYLLYPEMWPKAYNGDTLQTPSRFLSDFPPELVEEWRLGY
jgi:DNA helicase-2/ATP-dependent DNA helicase PcrA